MQNYPVLSSAVTDGISSITIDGTTDTITSTSGTIDFDDEDLVTTGSATATEVCIGVDCRTAWPTGGDNLGNHTATQALDMNDV